MAATSSGPDSLDFPLLVRTLLVSSTVSILLLSVVSDMTGAQLSRLTSKTGAKWSVE